MNGSDIVAMWIVALALVGAIGAQGAIPDLPPRLIGVQDVTARLEMAAPGVAGPVVPPGERAAAMPQDRGTALDRAGLLHNIAQRFFKC